MTDSPTTGRHRTKARRRGLIGPVVSALAVLLAVGPVAWAMTSRDGTLLGGGGTKILHVSEGDSGPAGADPQAGEDSTGKPSTRTTTRPTSRVTVTGHGRRMRPSATPSTSSAPTSPTTSIPTRTPSVTPRPSRSSTKPRPTTTRTTTGTPAPPPPGGGGTNAQEQRVLELTNAARRQNGCGPLSLDSSLVEAAGRHASDMVRRHYFDHTNPDGKSAFDRMHAAGFSGGTMGENIAAGYDSPENVVAGWMKSEGHRANILNCSYNKIGIGYDPGRIKSEWGNGSWVQDFGRS